MVFLIDTKGEPLHFTYAVFGVQHPVLTPEKKALITSLHSLLSSSADRVDHLRDESHGLAPITSPSTTFVAYWLHSTKYASFAASAPYCDFWDNLSDDAGVWREIMNVPTERYMFAASQKVKWGLATMADLKQSNDEGYWGVYRHRLGDVGDSYTSPYTTSPKTAADSYAEGEVRRSLLEIPERLVSGSENEGAKIRSGRIRVEAPDNLCFVREGQRQPNVSKEEMSLWLERISPHAQSWIEHLDQQRARNGVMAFTTHLGHGSLTPARGDKVDADLDVVDADAVPETNQLAYFLDLAYFEKAGRAHKGHVTLRKTVMEIYGPGGQMDKLGKAELFVELCVLKKGDLEAEYIGCTEGTGLMWLEGLEST